MTIARSLTALVLTGVLLYHSGCFGPPDIDEVGGTVLVYRIADPVEDDPPAGSSDELISAIERRLDPDGNLGITAMMVDEATVEVAIPGDDRERLARVKRLLKNNGHLQFLILANKDDHKRVLHLAAQDTSGSTIVSDGNNIVGKWVDVTPTVYDENAPANTNTVDVANCVTRALPATLLSRRAQRRGDVQVLVVVDRDPSKNIDGRHINWADPEYSDTGPAVNFQMNERGAKLLGRLTSSNLPDEETLRQRRLAIILDNRLIAAPNLFSTITDRGQITGQFDINYLVAVMRFGRLPVALQQPPIAERIVEAKDD
jgi:SecD/SecF fusion protein